MVVRHAVPRILTIDDAERLGISRSARRHAMRARGWQSLAPGILLTRDEAPTREDWAAVGLAVAGPHAALSGWDAVRIHGLGSRTPPTRTVLILDTAGTNRRVGDVLIRPTRRSYSATVLPAEHPSLAFAPVVEAARAVADTALLCPTFTPVRALVTGAIQRQRCTASDLARELDRCPRGGSRWLRRSLADIMFNAQSVAEAEAVELLTRARVPAFEVNVPVLAADGSLVAVLDILWRELRAVLEIDSREFHFSENDWKGTLRRHNELTRQGLAIEHHSPAVLRAGRRTWAAEVRGWLQSRAAELDMPFVTGSGPIECVGTPPPLQLPLIKRVGWSR